MWCWMNTFRNLKALTTQTGRVQWERKLECWPPWTPWPEGGSKAILRTGADPLHRSSGDHRRWHAGEGKFGHNLKGWKVEQVGEQSQSSYGHGVREGPPDGGMVCSESWRSESVKVCVTGDSQVGETELGREEAEAINSAEFMVRGVFNWCPRGRQRCRNSGWSRLSHHLILCDISESM